MKYEKLDARLPEHVQKEAVLAKVGTKEFPEIYSAREIAIKQLKEQERKAEVQGNQYVSSKPVAHSKYRKRK